MEENSRRALPYWLVNVPQEEWPSECPDYLKNVSEKDKASLSTLDADYHRLSWDEVKEIIG